MKGTALRTSWPIALLAIILWTPAAVGFPLYKDGGGSGCVTCHPGFDAGPPNAQLHQRHVIDFGITNCNVCHPSGGGSTPVQTYWSGAGGGLGCAGCHGRDYGETSPNSGQPKATAYGLRQYHINNGVLLCQSCHVAGALGHPNPLPPIKAENVAPPYYGLSHNNLTDPCSSAEEDLLETPNPPGNGGDADLLGLDNDGDGARDFPADADCSATTTTVTSTTTTTTPTSIPTMSLGGAMMLGVWLTLVMGWALARRERATVRGRSGRPPRR